MNSIDYKQRNKRIIALWAFSESVLGGFLHLFKIPVTGMVVGGLAVIFLSIIANQSNNKKEILKATLIVLIIKFVISPYTPMMAFLSVSVQGLFCYLFSVLFNKKSIGVVLFSISSLTFFSLQKLLMLQVLFGNSLWESINTYATYIAKQFGIVDIDASFLIITFYISLHVLGGIIFSILAINLIKELNNVKIDSTDKVFIEKLELEYNIKRKNKKHKLLKKVFSLTLLLLFIGVSYLFKLDKGFYAYLITVLRFFGIILVWLFVISPFITGIIGKYLAKKQSKYNNEVAEIINAFPHIKVVGTKAWEQIKQEQGMLKYFLFVKRAIINFLVY